MNINQENIVSYINYLFKKNNNTDAPHEIIQSWQTLTNEEIQIHLKNLYQHWNLPPNEANLLEQEFLNLYSRKAPIYDIPQPSPIINKQETPINNSEPIERTTNTKSNNNVWKVIAVLAICALAGFGVVTLLTKDENTESFIAQNKPAEQVNTTGNTPANAAPIKTQIDSSAYAAVAVADDPKIITPIDERNASAIEALFEAEYKQDFYSIYNSFSKNMKRYWAINNPTEADLKKLYENAWTKRTNIKQDNVTIDKVADNIYDVSSTYSAYDVEKNETIKRVVKTRFEFNNEGKIISTYGL